MANPGSEKPELVAAMLEPGFYPHAPESVELRETHISWVFLAGDFAYKVKKPLKLPFLDYGSLERRHRMCREEVRLNRRFAPQIYLGVVGITGAGGRWTLTSESDPTASEYAVEMRPVDETRSMATLAVEGRLERNHVLAVARRLARLHADAPHAEQPQRSVEVLIAALEENLATLRETGASSLGVGRLDSAEHFTGAFVAARREELEQRSRSGLVRDCHGDLRAEHVIVAEQEGVYIYDCIEFDPSLRQIDVAADFAFLVMDLVALGAEDLALLLVEAYRDAGGDPGDDSMLWSFASYRAWVRAKVALMRALELPEGSRDRVTQEAGARDLFRLGHRLAWRARGPLLLVICGVAASGKTSLARELATVSGWPHHSSDVTRKRLAGLAPEARAASDHYSQEFTERTYRELGAASRDALESASGVIVDATFHRRRERDAFRAGLGENSVPLLFVECQAPTDVLLSRLRERQRDPGRVSDADADVLRRQLAERESLEEVPPEARAKLVAEASPPELAIDVEAFVDSHAGLGRKSIPGD